MIVGGEVEVEEKVCKLSRRRKIEQNFRNWFSELRAN